MRAPRAVGHAPSRCRPGAAVVVGAVGHVVLAATTGLAAASVLPGPVQRAVAEVAAHVGIGLPSPAGGGHLRADASTTATGPHRAGADDRGGDRDRRPQSAAAPARTRERQLGGGPGPDLVPPTPGDRARSAGRRRSSLRSQRIRQCLRSDVRGRHLRATRSIGLQPRSGQRAGRRSQPLVRRADRTGARRLPTGRSTGRRSGRRRRVRPAPSGRLRPRASHPLVGDHDRGAAPDRADRVASQARRRAAPIHDTPGDLGTARPSAGGVDLQHPHRRPPASAAVPDTTATSSPTQTPPARTRR